MSSKWQFVSSVSVDLGDKSEDIVKVCESELQL